MLTSTVYLIIISFLSVSVIDLWQRIAHRLGGSAPTDWGIIGRWLLMIFSHCIIVNTQLQETDAYPNERAIGWIFHYLVGGAYVIVYFILWKICGLISTTIWDGFVFGAISVLVPWFFFMPAIGAGILARKTPNPTFVCISAFITHSIFGVSIALLLKAM